MNAPESLLSLLSLATACRNIMLWNFAAGRVWSFVALLEIVWSFIALLEIIQDGDFGKASEGLQRPYGYFPHSHVVNYFQVLGNLFDYTGDDRRLANPREKNQSSSLQEYKQENLKV